MPSAKECYMKANAANAMFQSNRMFDPDMMHALGKNMSFPSQVIEIDSELKSRGQQNYKHHVKPMNVTRKEMPIRAPFNRSQTFTRLQDSSTKQAIKIDRFMEPKYPRQEYGRPKWSSRNTQLEARDSFKPKKPKLIDPTLALPKCNNANQSSWMKQYGDKCQ